MVKNHLKRIASPKTWNILRKEEVFVARPNPGAHSLTLSLPVAFVLRDMMGVVHTMKEVKHIIHSKDVLVNGRIIRDEKFPVGLFDVVAVKKMNRTTRLQLSTKGKLVCVDDDSDGKKHFQKILGKRMSAGGNVQLQFANGECLRVAEGKYKTGDTVVYADKKISDHLPLNKGSYIVLVGGKHIGDSGVVDDIKGHSFAF